MKNKTSRGDEKLFPVLTTERLILRRFQQDDIGSVYKGLSHPEVIRHYGVSYGSMEATQEQMDWFEMIERRKRALVGGLQQAGPNLSWGSRVQQPDKRTPENRNGLLAAARILGPRNHR